MEIQLVGTDLVGGCCGERGLLEKLQSFNFVDFCLVSCSFSKGGFGMPTQLLAIQVVNYHELLGIVTVKIYQYCSIHSAGPSHIPRKSTMCSMEQNMLMFHINDRHATVAIAIFKKQMC